MKLRLNNVAYIKRGGAPTGGGRGTRAPSGPEKNTIFSGFLRLNYVICIFEVCFGTFLLCGRTSGATRISFRGGGGSELWERAPQVLRAPVGDTTPWRLAPN